MGLEKYHPKKKYDRDGKEIKPEPSYVNISIIESDMRNYYNPPDFSTITNRRLSILDD